MCSEAVLQSDDDGKLTAEQRPQCLAHGVEVAQTQEHNLNL